MNSLSMTLPSNRILVYSLLAEYDPFQLAPSDSCYALIPGRRIYLKGGNCLRSLLITRQFPNFLAVNCHWEKTALSCRSPFIPNLSDGGKTALEFPTRHRADECRNSSSALSHLGALNLRYWTLKVGEIPQVKTRLQLHLSAPHSLTFHSVFEWHLVR